MTKKWKSGWQVIVEHPSAPKRTVNRAKDAKWKDGGGVITMSFNEMLKKKQRKQKHIQDLFATRAGASGVTGGTGPSISGQGVPTGSPVSGVSAPTSVSVASATSSGGA